MVQPHAKSAVFSKHASLKNCNKRYSVPILHPNDSLAFLNRTGLYKNCFRSRQTESIVIDISQRSGGAKEERKLHAFRDFCHEHRLKFKSESSVNRSQEIQRIIDPKRVQDFDEITISTRPRKQYQWRPRVKVNGAWNRFSLV